MIRILVAEDDSKMNRVVCSFLRDNGFDVISCESGIGALEELKTKTADIIISDIMMPEMDGFELAAHIREKDKQIPILLMSALDDISAKQKGFALGIDDYMVKPLVLDELLIRIESLLRRMNIANDRRLTIGGFTMSIDALQASWNGREIPLDKDEFDILFTLLSHPKRTFTRNRLRDECLGADSESTTQAVDDCVKAIIAKTSDCGDFEIVAVSTLGYKAIVKQQDH